MLFAELNGSGYCTSLETLCARPDRDICPALKPDPGALAEVLEGQSRPSIIDTGLPGDVVLSGLLLGVDEALSTLAFLEPDRGVTLELKNVLPGVTTSSLASAPDTVWLVSCTSLRNLGVVDEVGDRTCDGVGVPLPVHFEAVEVFEVLRLGFLFCRSRVMIGTL